MFVSAIKNEEFNDRIKSLSRPFGCVNVKGVQVPLENVSNLYAVKFF